MTTLQDTAVGPASQNELISPARLLLLPPRNSAAGRRAVDLAPQTRLIAGRFLLFASLAK